MASPAEPMSVDEPETLIDSDQAKSTADDQVVHAEPSRFAPHFPVPVGGAASAPSAVALVDEAAADKTAVTSVAVCSETVAVSGNTDKNVADKTVTGVAAADVAIHHIDGSENTADEDVAVKSLAATANVEGVRHGGKAPEVFDGETLNADAPSDSGMSHVRVSIHGSLSLVAHTHVMLCVSQEKSQESS
jgi:hypothetical protein